MHGMLIFFHWARILAPMKRFNKTIIWQMVSRKINHSIHRLHVLAIINIFLEEFAKDLIAGKKIRIPNFGTFQLNELLPKKTRSIYSNEIKFVKRTKALRLKLDKKLAKYLSNKSIEDMKAKTCEEKQDQ